MNSIYLFSVYYIVSFTLITGHSEELVWYQGCFYSNSSNTSTVQNVESENNVLRDLVLGTSWNETIVGCARKCNRERYQYFSTSQTKLCLCVNESLETLEQVEESFCRINLTSERKNFLPYSRRDGYSAVYLSEGPYISHVTLTFDQTWIVVNTPVVLEVTIEIPKLLNISSDTSELWSPVQVSLNKASNPEQENIERIAKHSTCSNISEGWDGDQLFMVVPEKETFFVRIPHIFTSVGKQNLVVRVWNELSTLESEITATVHQPEPRDLQVVIQTDEANQPSCIPESFVLPENDTFVSIFVNAEFIIEASVANGNNLTFTYTTKNENEKIDETFDRPCGLTCDHWVGDGNEECRDSHKKMVLDEVGVYLLTVMVENQHGFLSKTLYLVVMEEKLASLNLTLQSNTKLLLPWQPAVFLVTMEVTSRFNTSLEVRFFKNHSHFATLEDSNSTSLSINCNQGEMSIVSTYGTGCDLAVQFEHDFDEEGTYNPTVIVKNNKDINITTLLLSNITVMNQLRGARLKSDRIVAVNQMTKITLNLTVWSVNMSVWWTVINALGDVMEIKTTTDPYLLYSFREIGLYHIYCNASNLMGSVSARTNVEVEETVSGLVLSCGQDSVVKTHQSINCISRVKYGSDVEFSWRIFNKNGEVFGDILTDNLTSSAAIIFEEPGKYNVTVFASNSVSRIIISLDKLITVEIPVSYVIILQKEPNMLGKKTDLKIITSESSNIQIEFDFGNGRVQHDYMYEKSKDAYYLEYLFDKAGIHNITVFAFNIISEVVGSVEVVVEQAVDKLEIMMYRAPAIGVPAVFILKTEGHILRRKDMVFYWEFSDGVQRISSSPVISKQFSTTGNHNINFTAKNLVSEYKRSLQVEVDDRVPAEWILLHNTLVAVQELVQFTLKGDNSGYDGVQISYGDGYNQAIEKNHADDIDTEIGWTHIYKKSGLHKITVELTQGETNVENIESVISVEEPVSGLKLTGPPIIEIKGLSLHHVWKADVKSGTNMVYMWDFGGETFHSTHSKFVRGFDRPGTHILKVITVNDISRLETNMTVIVQCPIVSLKLSATTVIFGKSTSININVTGGRADFIHMDYGDGVTETFSLDDKMVTMHTTEQGLPRYQITTQHEYQSIGDFEVTTNVSNLVSFKVQSNMSKVHEPIDGIVVTTESPGVFPLGEKVTVVATAASGQNLKFDWKFSDVIYRKPTVVGSGNTSIATHEFEFSGDYEVTVKVSNQLYREPVVARLPFKFQAVEEIVDLRVLDLQNNGKAMLKGTKPDQATDLITFTAVCDRGSHVTFIFHFGDGNSQIVQGAVNYLYMTSGEASHRYTEEGEYEIKVIAVNPLGNVTEYTKKPFIVQRPPMKPYLQSSYHIEYGQNFTFKVGEIEDKNITFDWKFGDLTDVVNSNKPEISHLYQKAGEYDLVVIANDRGTKTNTTAKVYVEHRIQGVTLNISSTILDASEPVRLEADVFPKYINLDIKYRWKLGSQNVPMIETDGPYIQHVYDPGRYTVAVTASNNVSSAISPAVVLHLLKKIKSLEVLMTGIPVINATLRFKASFFRGSEMTFLWDFDDGSRIIGSNDSSQYIEHVFTQEGEYNVDLKASNLISQARSRKQLFILNKICIAPKLTIHDSSYNKVNRSHGLQYEVDVTTSVCEDTEVALEYQWTIYNTSNNQPYELPHVDQYTFQQKRLVLKPCTLTIGFYKLEIKVQIKNSIVYSIETMEIEILTDPLNVIIKGGALREVARQDDVVLDGSISMDLGCAEHTDIRYNWTCSTSFDSAESCLKDHKTENLTLDQAVVVIPGDSILPNIDLVIVTLTVWKGDKDPRSTNQVIRIMDRPESVRLSMYCPQCEKQAINAHERLTLQAVCSNCSEDVMEYEWIIRFVFKSSKRRLTQEKTLCTIKKPDGKNFNLWTLPDETNLDKMYTSETDQEENKDMTDFVIHPSLLNTNQIRRKRQSLKNSSKSPNDKGDKGNTLDHTIPWYKPMSQGNTVNSGRRRQKSSRGSSRRTHYSRLDPLNTFPGGYPWTNLIGIQGTPKQGNSSKSRINKDSQVNPGVNRGGHDKVYNQKEKEDSKRPKHILEKKTGIIYIREDQTTTGTNKQSLIIKPGYFKQGFEYIITAKAKLKDGRVGGTAMTAFTVNTGPSKGVCEIMPDSGEELTTQFKLYCKEWKDKDKPLQYEVSFSYHENSMKYVIYRGLRQGIEFSLPAGDISSNYKVVVYISVLDDLLAKTSVCRYPLEVRPFSLESGQHLEDIVYKHTDFTNPLGGLIQAKQYGDDHQIRGVIQSLGRCLQRIITNTTASFNAMTFRKALNKLIEELGHLSMRNELEVLQTVQSLESLVTVTKEFDMAALETLVNIVKQIGEKVNEFKSPVFNENLYTLLHTVTSSLIESLSQHHQYGSTKQRIHREYLENMIHIYHSLLQKEMTYHTNDEGEITKMSSFITTKAVRYTFHDRPALEINQSKIILPENMEVVLKKTDFGNVNDDLFSPNQNCYQVHMTKYNFNPYMFDRMEVNKIQSEVCSLKILTCNGTQVDVKNLSNDNLLQIEVPRILEKNEVIGYHQLQRSVMNIHNFNVTYPDRNNSLNIEIDMVPVTEGRLFPIAVLINYNVPPTPSQYLTRHEIQGNHLQIFLSSGYLNFTGEYFIGILDAGLNKGRPRQGEITQRNYTLKLWWNKCLFWNETTRHWSDNGCWATDKSTYYRTHCICNHLTAFGSHFELIPNDLSHISVEDFFDLYENPVTVCLTGVILLLYVLLMVLCHKLDIHDARKGGITYLIDNNLCDKQKYEVTVETGFRKGAGTTAKISVILHGEEGMSETRELISDDDCPLFERNSRDKFIMTLPDSIGKIWKVQLWHNNFGSSPSWYLCRVIVKDLNSGSTYYFISEKWLAVEENDGKVEREFMALEGNLGFRKVFWAKGTQYLSDYHIWMSLLTCPSYSQFNRKQRLTCCLTLLMTYMCLNAMWYKENNPEYRGEFGLLDVSLRSITVGAICCGIVIPVNLLIVLLFRRSKMQQSGDQNEPIPDEEKEDEQFASGKPNEHAQEEEEVESVQPIMTYSILDQSILNWPSIQDWAQKQWVKRHQGYQDTSDSADMSHIPNQMVHQRILGSEIDQASSGFEDSNSTDPRRQITISSQNSSQKIKPPSVSSGHRPSNSCSRKTARSHLYLPYWCQFVAWFLCCLIIGTCAVITIMYGFRFGKCKSIMWLQSLYFSFMVCVFITQPFMIIIAVIYTAIRYKNDPSILDHYEDGEFGEKAKLEILRRKKEQIQYTEQEELERGVAARQRSRYLRFARPPQEKQLIEARKKIMKEKKAMSLIRDTAVISLMFVMLCVMAYGKDTSSPFYINEALKNSLIRSGPVKFNSIKFGSEWYNWSQTTMLDALYPPDTSPPGRDVKQGHQTLSNSIIIGQVQLRQLKVIREDCYCPYDLPFLPDDCFHDYQSSSQMKSNADNLTEYVEATSSLNIFGKHGIYDNSGYILRLNKTRSQVRRQLKELHTAGWINNQTRAVIVEFTLYNAPTNLFTSVVILLEIPSSGGAYPDQRIRSTHLYKYVSPLDNMVLAFELMFIILTVYKIGVQLCNVVKVENYFHNFWVVIDTIFSGLSLMYIVFYIYRFILVSETVENLRSTYFQQFVDVSFLAFWDEIIRCLVGMILFLVMIKFLRLLHYNKVFSLFATVYRRLQREMVIFTGLFLGSILIFSRIGHVLFGTFLLSFSDVISSILTVSALLTGIYEDYPMPDSTIVHTLRIFVLFFSVFATGLLTSYMVAILSYRFRIQKHKHSVFLVMKPRETILFYWQTFLLWTGIHSAPVDEEPDNILPPEFTMAEVEYQVDELFFRINTLTGSHGLPEKPTTYFTDSDGTYGLGDDGISSGGSEVNLEEDDRLENRVHKIEDSLCSHEPYIAQLLMDGVTKGREKQIRSHLEMEIFRQLQNQRNNLPAKVTEESLKSSATTSGSSSEMPTPFGDRKSGESTKKPSMGVSSLQQHTFIHHAEVTPMTDCKSSPYQARRSTTSSSSNPDSPDEIVKNIERVRLLKEKGGKKLCSKPEDNLSQSADTSKTQISKMVKKPEPPHKPTFQNPGLRDVQNQDFNKSSVLNSPALRQLRSSLQAIERDRHSFKGESGSSVTTESSSGSEQDAIHGKACAQAQLKRNLRKTKSRGKGKGSVNLTSVLLDDLDTSNDELGAAGTSFKISETEPIIEQEIVEDYLD